MIKLAICKNIKKHKFQQKKKYNQFLLMWVKIGLIDTICFIAWLVSHSNSKGNSNKSITYQMKTLKLFGLS